MIFGLNEVAAWVASATFFKLVGARRSSQIKAHHKKSSCYQTYTFRLEELRFPSNGCLCSVLDTS